MITEFKASNGVTVRHSDETGLYVLGRDLGVDYRIYEYGTQALREFFRHEEDERLGRWRWPENPEYVVYPMGLDHDGFRYARCLNERLGAVGTWQEGAYADPPITDPDYLGIYAVTAYFDAHPERKPWHDAKHDEVWALTLSGSATERLFQRDNKGWNEVAQQSGPYFILGDFITTGRRIWPPEQS